MPKHIKIIALDIDGTLLDDNGRLPAVNVRAVYRAQAQGIQILLATGKTRQSALGVIAELGLQTPGVYTQGLMVYDQQGQILRQITLDQDTAVRILIYLEEMNLPYIAYCTHGLVAPRPGAFIESNFIKYGEPRPEIIDHLSLKLDTIHINKILIGDGHNIAALREELAKRFGHQVRVIQAIPEFAEIMPKGSSKGNGVGWLLGYLGFAPGEMLAVGDGENDLEMLRLAGTGVAMGNAQPIVQAAADFVVAGNHAGGVAEAIERYALNEN